MGPSSEVMQCRCKSTRHPAESSRGQLRHIFSYRRFLSQMKRVSKNCTRVWAWSSGGAYVLILVSAGELSLDVHWVSQTTPRQGKVQLCGLEAVCKMLTVSSLMVVFFTSRFYLLEWAITWFYLSLRAQNLFILIIFCFFKGKLLVWFNYP